MKNLIKIFHFLGGIYLAIFLIAISAVVVIAGTFIESATDSHQAAANWTYSHPLFYLLLCLFFINILFAALRRWPFEIKHIPFLITHLGLLMIIAGTMIKNKSGIQGNLMLWEGSGNENLTLPHTYAINISSIQNGNDEQKDAQIALNSLGKSVHYPKSYPELKCNVLASVPHAKQTYETWIKDGYLFAYPLPTLKVDHWQTNYPMPSSCIARWGPHETQICQISASKTDELPALLRKLYLNDMQLTLHKKGIRPQTATFDLTEACERAFEFAEGVWTVGLDLKIDEKDKLVDSVLNIKFKPNESSSFYVSSIKLNQESSLELVSDNKFFASFFTVDLIRKLPAFHAIQSECTHLYTFDTFGRIHEQLINNETPEEIFTIEKGFGGYFTRTQLPLTSYSKNRTDLNTAKEWLFKLSLSEILSDYSCLTLPLRVFANACNYASVSFADALANFLSLWHQTSPLLFQTTESLSDELQSVFKHFDWSSINQDEIKSALWTIQIFRQMEPFLQKGECMISVLQNSGWPFTNELKEKIELEPTENPYNLLAAQIFSMRNYLPMLDHTQALAGINQQALLLSALLRIYSVDYDTLIKTIPQKQTSSQLLSDYWKSVNVDHSTEITDYLEIQTPIRKVIIPENPPIKWEDRRPAVLIEVEKDNVKEKMALLYDPTSAGMHWPILNGAYVMHFEPQTHKLPYHLRLRQARKLTYPDSQHVHSYECDLSIKGTAEPAGSCTLSMNRVHETWDGYRFYLSAIGSSTDQTLKYVQLVVNHDPVKFYLTYPGAILVFIGITLLFWFYPLIKKRKSS